MGSPIEAVVIRIYALVRQVHIKITLVVAGDFHEVEEARANVDDAENESKKPNLRGGVQAFGFRVQDSGFRVEGSGSLAILNAKGGSFRSDSM